MPLMPENDKQLDAAPKKSWKWGCGGVIILCVTLAYTQWFFSGYVPVSTLPFRREEPDACDREAPPLWPRTIDAPDGLLPAFSPDGKYYIAISKAAYRDAEELRFYESSTNRFLGSYSYHELYVFCWGPDSSGVFLDDSVPECFGDVCFQWPPDVIDVKKVLIPCRGDLRGVSLLPRLYWEMRCALPGSEYSLFAVWFPLVVMVTGFAVGLRIILWVWRRVVWPWWYGE